MNFSFCQLLLLPAVVFCLSDAIPEDKKGDTTTTYVPYESQAGSCLTDIVRVICSIVNKPPIVHKRKDELINNILGLPRILQDIGK